MIFEIEKTSHRWTFDENEPPCRKAFIKEFKEPKYWGKHIEPQKKTWLIELNTLKDLLNLQKEIGEDIIIGDTSLRANDIGVKHYIEIYDDYRE